MRPVVGVTAYVVPARWGTWDARATLVPHAYVTALDAAGARPVVLPPDPDASELLDRLDAVVLAGGGDIDPARYGAAPAHPAVDGVSQERDDAELHLAAAAMERDMPLLGICRGLQVLAVACGGSLHQHLPDVVGHDGHRPTETGYGRHPVRLEPGSLVHGILGDRAEVHSHHHQGIASPGSLTVTGTADDGVVEALESPRHRFVLGVLWHPEEGPQHRDGALFRALVTAAG